jgi:hypothetical protein
MSLQKYALAAAMVLTVSAPALAQNRIGGVVRDETGSTIRGATVRAETGGTVSSAAPVTLTTATDDRGRFVFVVVRSGEWRLTIEAPGFAPQTIPLSVRLSGAAPNLDVKLDRRESPEAFGNRLSGSAEERCGRYERVICDGKIEGSTGKCGRRKKLVRESLRRGCGLDSATHEIGGARSRRRRPPHCIAPSDPRHRN